MEVLNSGETEFISLAELLKRWKNLIITYEFSDNKDEASDVIRSLIEYGNIKLYTRGRFRFDDNNSLNSPSFDMEPFTGELNDPISKINNIYTIYQDIIKIESNFVENDNAKDEINFHEGLSSTIKKLLGNTITFSSGIGIKHSKYENMEHILPCKRNYESALRILRPRSNPNERCENKTTSKQDADVSMEVQGDRIHPRREHSYQLIIAGLLKDLNQGVDGYVRGNATRVEACVHEVGGALSNSAIEGILKECVAYAAAVAKEKS